MKGIKSRTLQRNRRLKQAALCGILCILAAVVFNGAAVAEDQEKTIVTLAASPAEMVQDGELPEIAVKALIQGNQEQILDEKTGYTVQNLADELNKGEHYRLVCSADGKTEGEFPIGVELSEQMREQLVQDWLGKVEVKVKNASFTVKNKYGEWDGEKFKKNDGAYAANEYIVSQGEKYYFDGEGKKVTGERQIGIKKCTFDQSGRLQSEEFLIDVNKPMIALTFDDGPGPETGKILDVLEKYNARASFFMLGSKVGKYEDTVKRMQALGCDLGNHSATHQQLTKLSEEQVRQEIGTTSQAVAKAVGGSGTVYVRPPYGAVNDMVKAVIGQPVIMWSLDTLDWKTRNVQSTVNAVMNAKDGDIVLMHDIHKESVEAAVQLIPKLVEKGFQLVTVRELAEARGVPMENGVKYFKFRK